MGGRASDYISAALRHRLALGVGAVLAAICAVVAVTALAGPRGLPVTGFQDASSDSPSVIDRDAHALNTVAVDGVLLQDGGGSLAPLDRSALGALRRTRADGLRAELVISNWNARLQDFAQPTATRLLTSQANIDSVARQLAALVSAQGWDGVCVDIEAMTAADGSGLAQFLQRLRTLLGHGRSLAVTVANNTSPADYVSAGYQLADLGRVVDRVILMAYDEHGPWESTPGPIGSLDWQRQGLSVLLAAVPASKVDLGVAGYGYWWQRPPASTVQISDAAGRALRQRPGASVRFDSTAGEWVARLPNGSVAWWSDSRSYALRVRVAQQLHLHGLAIWSLGLADPLR